MSSKLFFFTFSLWTCLLLSLPLLAGETGASPFLGNQPSTSPSGIDRARPYMVFGLTYGISGLGNGLAHITFFTRDEFPDERGQNVTIGVSLAITPLLGASLARLITKPLHHYTDAFWPMLIGAYAGAGISLGALVLFHQADAPGVDETYTGGYINSSATSFREFFFTALFQVILPMTLPAVGTAAGYALGRKQLPSGAKASFLTPTLFPSASNKRNFILGVQLVDATF